MSLPEFSTQAELFSTAGLSASMFAPTDRYRLFAKLVYPLLAAARATLEKCYCLENGRVALEPVLMLGASLLQYLDGVPDRQAVELLHYHAGWNFALNRQLGDEVFHPTSLGNFRDRLEAHKQSTLGFTTILDALEEAGLVARQSRQRLDSTQMFGRVAKMSRLDCVRESLRLALNELAEALPAEARPRFWVGLWERYVESQVDYRVSAETLGRKLAEAGTDAWQLLEWLGQPEASRATTGPQVELLRRIFGEQFDLRPGQATPVTKEVIVAPASGGRAAAETPAGLAAATTVQPEAKSVLSASGSPMAPPSLQAEILKAGVAGPAPAQASGASDPNLPVSGQPEDYPAQSQPAASGAEVQSEDKKQSASARVQNPHEQDATPAATGQGDQTKEQATPAAKEIIVASASGGPVAAETPAGPAATTAVPPEADSVPSASSSPVAPSNQSAELLKAGTAEPATVSSQASSAPDPNLPASGQPKDYPAQSQPAASGAEVQSEDKRQSASARVQNPHEQDATPAATGQGDQTKEQAAPAAKEIIVAPAGGGPTAVEAPAGPAATTAIPPAADSVPSASSRPVAPPGQPAELLKAGAGEPAPVPAQASGASDPNLSASGQPKDHSPESQPAANGLEVQPKDKKELASARVQNPHEPEATYAAKGQGDHWKEHVGYKIQVAETVCEATLAPGEPTRNFIVGIVTHPAYESDEAGAAKMEAEQAAMGLGQPPVQYVDGAYISAQKLVEAAAAGRELIGPAPPPATNNEGRFTSDLFRVEVEQRRATCPAGHQNTQCSRLEEQATKRVSFRFEWDTGTCAACPLRGQCIKGTHPHRTLVVGEHHTALQARRQEQRTEPFKQRMKHRNGIEGTQSELVRGHGLRHARYRGLAKTKLQNYFTAAACNVKRWLRRAAWKMEQAAAAAGPSLAARAS